MSEPLDKTNWPDGPWMREPDKVVWVDPNTDLDCMIVRNRVGALCGYVGVGPDHPYYDHPNPYELDLDVHGGANYGARCQENGEICHVPEPGREHDIYWIGFDCSHGMDICPSFEEIPSLSSKGEWKRTYKDQVYVTEEVMRLAKQLKEMS